MSIQVFLKSKIPKIFFKLSLVISHSVYIVDPISLMLGAVFSMSLYY